MTRRLVKICPDCNQTGVHLCHGLTHRMEAEKRTKSPGGEVADASSVPAVSGSDAAPPHPPVHELTHHGMYATCSCGWLVTADDAPEGADAAHAAHVGTSSFLRYLARRCHNGAGDPWQEFYDQGLSPVLDRMADRLDQHAARVAAKEDQ